MDISLKIKMRRLELGLSAKEVATRLNIAESTYRDWENGRKIQGEPYLELAKILDLPLTSLFGVETSQEIQQLINAVDLLVDQAINIKRRALTLI